MPPKRESPEEKYARATRIANIAVCKADYIRCCMAMKDKPDIINSVKKYLISIDAWDGTMPERKLKEEDDDEQIEIENRRLAGLAPTANLDVEMHRNFATWSQIPPSHLMTVLQMIEPVALNAKVLHIYCKGAQRVVPKEICLQFIEFTCDVDPSSTIDGERTLGSMVDLCTDLNRANGRRAQMFEHPVSWAKKGFYTLSKNDELKHVLHKIGGSSRVLPSKLLSLIEDPALLYIDQNHSERRSSLRHRTDKMLNVSCYQLMCDAENVVVKSLVMSGSGETVEKQQTTQEPEPSSMAAPVDMNTDEMEGAIDQAFKAAKHELDETLKQKVKSEKVTPVKAKSLRIPSKTPSDMGYRPIRPPPKRIKT
jgi:hypothetical protein